MPSSTWIVIPGYNESKHIKEVLQETKKYADNIVVVDDGSKDNTYDIAYETGVFVLKNIVNMGKGAALRTGCDFALKNGAERIIVMDSDGQHDPKDIARMKKALEDYPMVFTYRKLSGAMPFILRFGNAFINKTIKFLYGVSLKGYTVWF